MAWLRSPRFPRPAGPAPPPPSAADGAPAVDPLVHVPSPRRMRRERHTLARRREMEIRDVGGLAVEMVRRDRFRPELLLERANEVLRLEQRMHELDGFLVALAAAPRGMRAMPTCRCGAPLLPGAHFCSNCGRPSSATSPVLACSHCGQPLPADSNFCAFCGHPVAAEELAHAPELEDTVIRRSADEQS